MIALEFLLLIWDGFRILSADAFGWDDRRASRFADVAWVSCVVLALTWLASLTWLQL